MNREVDNRPSVVAAVPSRTMSIAAAVRIGWSLYRNMPNAANNTVIMARLVLKGTMIRVTTAR